MYYKNYKTHNMVIKNNTNPVPQNLQKKTNVVYKFTCLLSLNNIDPSIVKKN